MARLLVMVICVALAFAGTACHGPPSATRDRQTPTPFEQQQARAAYINSHYEKYLQGGRTTDKKIARAMAALEWDNHARRNWERNSETVQWSSDTRAKTEQRAFEQKLREMGY
jgi:hypothetical protein